MWKTKRTLVTPYNMRTVDWNASIYRSKQRSLSLNIIKFEYRWILPWNQMKLTNFSLSPRESVFLYFPFFFGRSPIFSISHGFLCVFFAQKLRIRCDRQLWVARIRGLVTARQSASGVTDLFISVDGIAWFCVEQTDHNIGVSRSRQLRCSNFHCIIFQGCPPINFIEPTNTHSHSCMYCVYISRQWKTRDWREDYSPTVISWENERDTSLYYTQHRTIIVIRR